MTTTQISADHRATNSAAPIIAGAIDCSVILAYTLGVQPSTWHFFTLAAKFALIAASRSRLDLSISKNHFAIAGLVALASSIIVGRAQPVATIQAFAFLAHFTATLVLVRRDGIRNYLAATAIVITTGALAHTALASLGLISQHYGRYFYLGNSHPNLGGEIAAVGAFAAYIAFRRRILFLVFATMLGVSVLMLQSRSAALTIMLLTIARLLLSPQKRQNITWIAATSFGCSLLIVTFFGELYELSSNIFLLQDVNRGTVSGFAGRNARWQFAWQTFVEHPFFGAGLGYYEARQIPSPHNFALYALAKHGIFGAAVITSLIALNFGVARRSAYLFAGFAALLPLLIFNDRYMNLNPYPFVYFVALVALGTTEHTMRRVRQDAWKTRPQTMKAS